MTSVDLEHVAILIGIIGTLLGVRSGLKAWREERDKALRSRVLHEDLLTRVLAQFEPNGGNSLIDKFDALADSVREHHTMADRWWCENAREHAVLHRRIDAVYETIGRPVVAADPKEDEL